MRSIREYRFAGRKGGRTFLSAIQTNRQARENNLCVIRKRIAAFLGSGGVSKKNQWRTGMSAPLYSSINRG